jgi:TPR repeat protein
MLYLDGHGVPKDYVQAYMWFRLTGFESNANLSLAKARMTTEQILEAERLAVEWKSWHPVPQCAFPPSIFIFFSENIP